MLKRDVPIYIICIYRLIPLCVCGGGGIEVGGILQVSVLVIQGFGKFELLTRYTRYGSRLRLRLNGRS